MNTVIVHHYTNVDACKAILDSGMLSPNSPRSAIAKMPFFGRLLPPSHQVQGIFGIRDCDLPKWNADPFALDHLAQMKSLGKDLVRITLEVEDTSQVEILEEKILLYELLPLGDKYGLREASKMKLLLTIPRMTWPGLKLYDKYVQSRVPASRYKGNYDLPAAFMKKAQPLDGTLIGTERFAYQEKFNSL